MYTLIFSVMLWMSVSVCAFPACAVDKDDNDGNDMHHVAVRPKGEIMAYEYTTFMALFHFLNKNDHEIENLTVYAVPKKNAKFALALLNDCKNIKSYFLWLRIE